MKDSRWKNFDAYMADKVNVVIWMAESSVPVATHYLQHQYTKAEDIWF